jgi:hypothetical protein
MANALGVPGFVRDADYRSEDERFSVRVRRGRAFTTVSINNVDVYFQRWSGHVDGVGLNPRPKSRSAAAGKSGRSGGGP